MNILNLPQGASTRVASGREGFSIGIVGNEYRDAYVALDFAIESEVKQALVSALESAGLRPVCVWEGRRGLDDDALTRVIQSCSVVVVVSGWNRTDAVRPSRTEVRIARTHRVPVIEVQPARESGAVSFEGLDGQPLRELLAGLPQSSSLEQPYAFMAVRIHDDFQLVREAIRVVVESELGIPCIYFEDRRVVTSIAGVRERTRELIRRAAFFVADLTYSQSNPAYDSPNTAHEIGMAMAYGIPLVVSAQAPRRNLYFSAADLDTLFWKDEADLAEQLRAWLRPRRDVLGARVISFESPSARFKAPQFQMDPARRYAGPPGRGPIANLLLSARASFAAARSYLKQGGG